MDTFLPETVGSVLGAGIVDQQRMGRGHNAELTRAVLSDGRVVVVKTDDAGDPEALAIEGRTLRHLGEIGGLRTPAIYVAEPGMLIMEYLDHDSSLSAVGEIEAADQVAALHGHTAECYGFAYDTRIGPLAQPNPQGGDWCAFFRDHRLMAMARAAHDEGVLAHRLLARIETLAARLDALIGEPGPPVLIHGDLWGGNVLGRRGHLCGFIDPAVYYADAEIELAFSTLFQTFGQPFFDRYREHHAIRPGFFEVRRDLYNLYPLLVHVRLFQGSYGAAVERIVARFVGG